MRGWTTSALLLGGLAVVVAIRWTATAAGVDALLVGLAFGLALAGLGVLPRVGSARVPAVAGSVRQAMSRRTGRELAIGALVGLGLLVLAGAGLSLGGRPVVPGLGRPAAPFLPWVGITVLVAVAEEAVLRGRLFDAARAAGGLPIAITVTTAAFALMHVPLYGWHVVPLDVGVGLVFAGLRLTTGRVAAPAAAHAVADLATWWL